MGIYTFFLEEDVIHIRETNNGKFPRRGNARERSLKADYSGLLMKIRVFEDFIETNKIASLVEDYT